jgi:hypothetical protein
LWCSATTVILIEKSILNLSVDLMQPLLGTLGLLSICFHLILELRNAILGRAELMRKPLRRVDGMSAVLLGIVSGFVQKLQDRLAGFIELTAIVSRSLSSSGKRNYFGTHG